MLLTLEEIKQQCGISPDDDTRNNLLTLFALSAQKSVEHKTGRALFATVADLPVVNGWYATMDESPDLKLVMLLLVTHFNDNPSATTEVSVRTLPFSVNALVAPYIVFDASILPQVPVA
jgi:uncharacterized phage protein (predicted DNA packaging)